MSHCGQCKRDLHDPKRRYKPGLYFLQSEPDERGKDEQDNPPPREFIDDYMHDGCGQIASVEADCWIGAREQLAL